MPRQLFAMIVIQGRKGWDNIQEAEHSPRESCGDHIGWNFAKLLVLLSAEWCYFFTSGKQGSTVTHNESVIPGKYKTKARLLALKGILHHLWYYALASIVPTLYSAHVQRVLALLLGHS